MRDMLQIGARSFSSRLLLGTGKYRDLAQTKAAVDASGAQIITVAIRRTNIGQTPGEPSLLDVLPPSKYTLLPNSAGCYTADEPCAPFVLAVNARWPRADQARSLGRPTDAVSEHAGNDQGRRDPGARRI